MSLLTSLRTASLITPTKKVIHIHSSNYDSGKSGEVNAAIDRITRVNECKKEIIENDGVPHHRLYPSTENKLTAVCKALQNNAINYAILTPVSKSILS